MSDIRTPASILFDTNSVELAVTSSAQIPSGTRGLLVAGVDSTGSVHFATFVQDSLKITGSFGLTNQVFVTSTGSLPVTGSVQVLNQVAITVTSSLPVTVGNIVNVTGSIGVTGSVGIANFPNVQRVTGSVGVDGITFPETITVSGSVVVYTQGAQAVTGSVAVYTQGAQLVSGTVTITVTSSLPITGTVAVTGSVGITNFPIVQRITGSVGIDGLTFPETISVSGSVAIYTQGAQAVSGTVFVTTTGSFPVTIQGIPQITGSVGVTGSVSVTNFPIVQRVTGSVGIDGITFPETITVTGSISTYTQGAQLVSGTIGVNNFPSTQRVSGSISVFTDGAQLVSGTVTANVTGTVNLDRGNSSLNPLFVSGNITTTNVLQQTVSGSVAVYTQGAQLVSGTVFVTTTGSLPVVIQGVPQITGSVSVTGSVGVSNFPTVQAVTGSVAVYTQGAQLVSGTVGINNFPITQRVSGSVSVFTDGAQAVSGTVFVTTTGSLPVILQGISQITGSVGVTGSISITNFPTTQIVTGSVSVTGSVAITNFPTVQTVTGSVAVYTQGAQLVSGTVFITTTGSFPVVVQGVSQVTGTVVVTGSVSVTNFPSVQRVTGSVGVDGITFPETITVTGSISTYTQGPQAVSGSVAVYTQGAQLVSGTVTAGVTGTVNLDRGNNANVPLFVSGSVGVTGSVGIANFPTVQRITGSVGVDGITFPETITVTGSVATYTQGPQAVSGTVNIGNWPSIIGVTGSVSTYTQGAQAITGSVAVYTQGAQLVSGTIGINNFPVTQIVSGSVATYTQGAQLVSGTVFITTTGSFPVIIQGVTQVTGTIAVTGSVGISNFPTVQRITGSVGVDGITFPETIVVTGSVSTYTQGPQAVTGSVAVYTQGAQLVSGTVGINNFPATQRVSGSVSIFTDGAQLVSGTVTITVTSSLPVTVTAPVKTYDTGIQAVSGSVSVFTQGAQFVTGSVAVYTQGAQQISGTVNIGNWPPIIGVSGSVSTYTQGAQLISGTISVTGSVSVYTQGPQAVSGTVFVTTTGSLPVVIVGQPIQVTGSVLVINPANNPVNVTGSITTQIIGGSTNQGSPTTSGSSWPVRLTGLDGRLLRATPGGELRVAQLCNLSDLDSKYELDFRTFDTKTVVSGTVVHISSSSGIRCSVTNQSGSVAALCTNTYFKYSAGYTQFSRMSIINHDMGVTNQAREWGYFDDNNGIFTRLTGSLLGVVERSDVSGVVVDTFTSQSNWNIDKLDGTGTSGVRLSISASHIFEYEIQLFGVGIVSYFIDGYLVHQVQHANTFLVPYMRTAQLPMQVRVTNNATTSTSSSIDFICGNVSTDCQPNDICDYTYAAYTPVDVLVSTTEVPILSIRPTSLYNFIQNRTWVLPKKMSLSTEDYKVSFRLVWNASLVGSSFVSAASTSAVEYDISATSFSGGETLYRGLLMIDDAFEQLDLESFFNLYARFLRLSGFAGAGHNNAQDTLTLVAKNESVGRTRTNASLMWGELKS